MFKLCPNIFQRGETFQGSSLPLVASLRRSGQFICFGSNFEKAAYSLKQVPVQVSLNTNVYCDELEDVSDLEIFLNASADH